MAGAGPADAGNCALFARAETGIALYGQAGGWWDQAEGRYQRGHRPAVGAILVFERSHHMPAGHVAVVSAVRGAREILIDDGDWYRGSVVRRVSVLDTSPDNDWTTVSVLDLASGKHGRDNPTFGFVYPDNVSPGLDTLVEDGTRPAHTGLVRLAAAEQPAAEQPEDQGAAKKKAAHKGASKHKKKSKSKSKKAKSKTKAKKAKKPAQD